VNSTRAAEARSSSAVALADEGCAQLLAAEAAGADATAGSCWWVVHTRARQEKKIVELVAREDVSYFLPLVHRPRRRGRHAADIPLFPGYLFLWGDERAPRVARATNRAAAVLAVPDQGRFEHEVRQIYRAVQGPHPVDLYPGLRVGQRCRICSGGLRGVEGVVERRDLSRVFLAATFLGQSAVVEVDTTEVELID
jgi:transcriptional antiterminator RfaH